MNGKRAIVIIALAASLVPGPAAAQDDYPVVEITTILPAFERMGDSLGALGRDIYDPSALAEVEDASSDLIVILDANPPEACWAPWWADVRSSAWIAGHLPDAVRELDLDMVNALATVGTLLINQSTTDMETWSCK